MPHVQYVFTNQTSPKYLKIASNLLHKTESHCTGLIHKVKLNSSKLFLFRVTSKKVLKCLLPKYQEDVVKDLSRTVHLAQNNNHLFVDELLELSQVACHVHFQLCPDLWDTISQRTGCSV